MGLVDSLFGKDARKFLKRKDSDAAEAGTCDYHNKFMNLRSFDLPQFIYKFS